MLVKSVFKKKFLPYGLSQGVSRDVIIHQTKATLWTPKQLSLGAEGGPQDFYFHSVGRCLRKIDQNA